MILFFCYSKPLMKNISFVLEMKKKQYKNNAFLFDSYAKQS